ncbi:MAG: hypothetical protein ACTH2Y_14250 [Corynebacterium sp.]
MTDTNHDRIVADELYAANNDILCAHHIDYIDCGDCVVPDFTEERNHA